MHGREMEVHGCDAYIEFRIMIILVNVMVA